MRKRSGALVAGLILMAVGGVLLANQFYPGLLDRFLPETFSWPWYVIGTGAVFIFLALLTGAGGLAIPGSIVGTIGLILNYQNISGDWESWAFMWVLIPASVGLGIILMALIEGRLHAARSGLWLLTIDLIIFLVFWAIFRRDSTLLAGYWPVLLIAAGVFILFESLFSRNRGKV